MSDTPEPEEGDESPPSEEGDKAPLQLFPICERCGQQHARRQTGKNGEFVTGWKPTCAAHTPERDEEGRPIHGGKFFACKKWPKPGLQICSTHGGSSPQMKRISEEYKERMETERKIRLSVKEIDEEFRQQHPLEGLLDEVARSAQIVAFLATQVAELHVEDPQDTELADLMGFDADGHEVRAPNRSKLIGVDHNNNLSFHPLYMALERERHMHAKLCTYALQAGVAEKMVNIAQAQAGMIARTLVAVLDNLGMPAERVEDAKRMVVNILRAGGPESFLAAHGTARALPNPEH
jgi:hypothetical protein